MSVSEPRLTPDAGMVRISPRTETVHRLFESQVRRKPDAVAAVCADERLTYRELNLRANRLARHLEGLGVSRGTLVGLCVERSLDTLVGILGILKAGGAYVPLDPGYPRDRLAFMVSDSAAPVVVTRDGLSGLLPEGGFRRVHLDRDAAEIDGQEGEDRQSGASAGELAYVIYTSGSTGRPKGVMIEHASVTHMFRAIKAEVEFGPDDVWTAFHSYAFDLSVWEMFGALLHGGRLVIVPREVAQSPRAFGELIAREGVTVLSQTPAAARQLGTARREPAARAEQWKVRVFVCGGEALPGDLASELLEWGFPLWNFYGPTEATVWTTVKRVQPGDCRGGVVSIGHPIAGTRAYVLDPRMDHAPAGVAGDLYIGGAGLARGYLRRPELDAERFMPDPFQPEPGARVYRTGDRARCMPSGELEFLGRDDFQVKIRGFRIELGEIEASLTDHSSVRQAVVLAREDEPDDKRLVAYVVAATDPAPGSAALRAHLHGRLPEYMVPSAFVFLDALPLSSNGKIDRRALPLPPPDRPNLDVPYVAPGTPLESAICAMYSDLLGIENIGIDDGFFDLGGHSVIATQLVSRLRGAFQLELPLGRFFQSPTVRETARWISAEGRADGDHRVVSIPRTSRGGDVPLSLPQENVWFLQNLRPDNRAYHFQPTLRFRGRIDADVLRRSLDEIVRRHEVYRTTFPVVDATPVQRVRESASASLSVVDLQDLPAERRETELERRIGEEIRKPFDLAALPLIRWTLFRLGPEDYVLQHVEHHMVHDGWSFNVFLRELATLYRSYLSGSESPLAQPEIQFADFARFQRQWIGTKEAAAQRAYWTTKLASPPPPLEIPSDRPRPQVQTFRGSAHNFELSVELAESLRALSRKEGCTLFMTMLAAFATLLHRYTRRQDFCIGSGIANRRWMETEGLIGMVVNTVALRMDLAGEPTFAELLRRVRDVTLEGYANQDYPFAAVVEAVQPERSLRHSPLCQVLFSFHDSPHADLDFGGPQVGLQEIVSNGSAKFDLNIVCIPRSEQRVGRKSKSPAAGITVAWEYSTELFDDATAHRMFGHFETLLRSAAADPDRPVSSLTLLTEPEERQIRVEFNDTATDYPRSRTVAELFEAEAAKTPDAPAVVSENGTLTYADLNRKANRLADAVARQGLAGGTVGVCLDRSPELIVSLLAVLKAGAAYVPIDPSYPSERIAYLFSDARVPVVLTSRDLAQRLPVGKTVRAICVDSDGADVEGDREENPESTATADAVAYVMYTSGSTGRPKGVRIPHRGIVRLAKSPSYVNVGPEDTVLQFAPISFDASTFEIWGALLNGARLALVPPGMPSLAELGDVLVKRRVSVLWLPAGLFHQMVDEQIESLRGVRQVIAGGDTLSVTHTRTFLRELPENRLVNGYGPTENTTFTCTYPVADPDSWRGSVPIGRPIANTRVYLLDARDQLVPIGVPGELHAGGDGLALGYLNREDLTAEKFVADPFGPAGGRLYRTGDVARFRADGNIEFLGRDDSQVKVRGYRIELGEVETALKSHPGLRDAVVIAEEGAEKRLFAFVVPADGATPPAGELRRHLAGILPGYMIPAGFLAVEAIPLTPNGKVDRSALRPPESRRPEAAPFSPPRTEVEKILAEVWKEVLKVDRVGVDDNFFELGGHSLLATRIISRVRDSFGVELPIRTLFESSTIAAFAEAVSKRPRNADAPITPVDRNSRRMRGPAPKDAIAPAESKEKDDGSDERIDL